MSRGPGRAADAGPDGNGEAATSSPRRHTRWLYARVLIVQALTLLALWLLQATFGAG